MMSCINEVCYAYYGNGSFARSGMKKEIITIAGVLGSGKSSTAKRLASMLGYRHFSSGDMFRQIAKKNGLTVEELNQASELLPRSDRAVDDWLRSLGTEEKIVIDSRLAYHWIPDSYKVFLNLDMHVAVERIFKHMKDEGRESQSANSLEGLREATQERRKMEVSRYKNLYQIDLDDLTPFDLVVDTSLHDLDGVVQLILTRYREFLGN